MGAQEMNEKILFRRELADGPGADRAEELAAVRLRLLEFSAEHSLGELLQKTLDEAEVLSGSQVGFYHFVAEDQVTLSLQAWSTRTLAHFCKAEGNGLHYAIDKAGVWVDCVRERAPVIHNDYALLPHQRGLPPGHASLVRELVVPILRNDKVVAVLGVGNKPTNYLEDDARAVTYLADVAWEITRRKRSEIALRDSEEELKAIFNHTSNAIAFTEPGTGKILKVNDTWVRQTGVPRSVAIGRTGLELGLWPEEAAREAMLAELAREGRLHDLEVELVVAGERRQFAVNADFVELGRGRFLLWDFRDVTDRARAEAERRKLEEQLAHAQKMESVGRLAGGVAHDFNNMMGVILAHAEMALESLPATDPVRKDMLNIQSAAKRSADVTRQLLAFARKQMVRPKLSDLNAIIAGTLKMVRRLIGEDIRLDWRPCGNLGPVLVDASQIDQIIASLCLNAREAIFDVGSVAIETGTTLVPAGEAGVVSAGEYVWLAVSDDGNGMDEAIQAQAFEPFFTTKSFGSSTGLGLATVYGIAKQNHGFVDLQSAVGKGTRVTVHFPRQQAAKVETSTEAMAKPAAAVGGTVLLVEDESDLAQVVTKMLTRVGYHVITTTTPAEAIRSAQGHAGTIDLLVTDVVMPEMNGRDLANRLVSLFPRLRCLFMSGYTAEVMGRQGVLGENLAFIEKPFSALDLLAKVRELVAQT
jgi:PAS domain S-box-containing protein